MGGGLGQALAVGVGATLGALLRWQLTLRLPFILQAVAGGTLAANLLGGFLVGVASAFFSSHPALPPHWRLLAVTGFLGGLTTFSTFSAENITLLQSGQIGSALLHTALHLFGSLLLCYGGMLCYRSFS